MVRRIFVGGGGLSVSSNYTKLPPMTIKVAVMCISAQSERNRKIQTRGKDISHNNR